MNLSIPPRWLGYATLALAAVVISLGIKHRYDTSVIEKADNARATQALTVQRDSLAKALKVSNTQIAHDTVVLDRAITRYVTLRDTISLTDTVEVKVALARCDTVVEQARISVASLTVGIKTRDAAIVNRDSTIRLLNARFPSAVEQAENDAKWAIIGAIGDELIHAIRRKR